MNEFEYINQCETEGRWLTLVFKNVAIQKHQNKKKRFSKTQ